MNINIICIGKLKEKYWQDACAEYSKRLGAYCNLKMIELKEEKEPKNASPADIDRHYTPKEQLPENIRFVSINNKQTLAQVFTDLRYTKHDNEAFSENLRQALRQQGFITKTE